MQPKLGNALRLQHRPMFANLPAADAAAAIDPHLLVDDGWYTLLDVLCIDLQYETDNEDAPQVSVLQVKEKFGRLRFRVDHASDRQRAMIRLAESLSARTCEACGSPAVELSILEHQPRCTRHFVPVNEQGATIRPKPFAFLERLERRISRKRGLSGMQDLEQLDALNEAIRLGDLPAVQAVLSAGAPLWVSTMDSEGCHSPLELAQKYGDPSIIDALNIIVSKHNSGGRN